MVYHTVVRRSSANQSFAEASAVGDACKCGAFIAHWSVRHKGCCGVGVGVV